MNLPPHGNRDPACIALVTGFTLIEMMVVISIIAILAALAVPSYQDFIANQRQRTMASDLAGDLAEARAEAMKRHSTVIVVANGGNWLAGWNIQAYLGEPFVDANGDGVFTAGEFFVDLNTNGVHDDNGGFGILKTSPSFAGSTPRSCSVDPLGTIGGGAFGVQIVFRGDGTVANATAGVEDGIRLSDASNRPTTDIRDIRVAPTGRISVDVFRPGDPRRVAFAYCP